MVTIDDDDGDVDDDGDDEDGGGQDGDSGCVVCVVAMCGGVSPFKTQLRPRLHIFFFFLLQINHN